MNKIIVIMLSMFLMSCGSTKDYHALSICQYKMSSDYREPDKTLGTTSSIESVHFVAWSDERMMMITHVDCEVVRHPWDKLYLAPGKHTLRVKIEMGVIKPAAGMGALPAALIAGVNSGYAKDSEKSAQNLEIVIEPGKNYKLYGKLMNHINTAFWVKDGNTIVATSDGYESKYDAEFK